MSAQNSSFTTWRYEQPFGTAGPGTTGPAPFFHNAGDERRSMYMTPGSAHPDGYLGTIQSRRGDRVLNRLKGRQNQRSYQRGVHKGERVDQSDYFWTEEVHPLAGIERQAATWDGRFSARRVPSALQPERTLGWEGKITHNEPIVTEQDGVRAQRLRHLLPSARR